jgi:hypothetical protein
LARSRSSILGRCEKSVFAALRARAREQSFSTESARSGRSPRRREAAVEAQERRKGRPAFKAPDVLMASWRRSHSSWTHRRTSPARIARASPRPTPRPETPSWLLPSVEAGSGTSPPYPKSPRGMRRPADGEFSQRPRLLLRGLSVRPQPRQPPIDGRFRADSARDPIESTRSATTRPERARALLARSSFRSCFSLYLYPFRRCEERAIC